MNSVRPKAIDDGYPRSALTVYSTASQSPMNGSAKIRMRISATTAGGNHQRHEMSSFERVGTVINFHFLPLPAGERINLSLRRFHLADPIQTIRAPTVRWWDQFFEYAGALNPTRRKQLAGR